MLLDEGLLIRRTIALGFRSVAEGGRPFATLVARDGGVLAESNAQTDPLLHSEAEAIGRARTRLGVWELRGCEIYTLCQPCAACLGLCRDAKADRVVFLALREECEPYYPEDEEPEEFTGWLPMLYVQEPDAVDVCRLWAADHLKPQ
ncbi:tRNA-specific adenosine deaminase [Streptomyces sp. RB5]|uniref:tRNA-specific adenosine deaminase n=2 Tax=Streptomyces smaragdinus TaxID=2585196 RepID=A0A7K0CQE7_9ACTN|nr:tRNA-specific adenosine deaminase [Streptomyces smaragdinus]